MQHQVSRNKNPEISHFRTDTARILPICSETRSSLQYLDQYTVRLRSFDWASVIPVATIHSTPFSTIANTYRSRDSIQTPFYRSWCNFFNSSGLFRPSKGGLTVWQPFWGMAAAITMYFAVSVLCIAHAKHQLILTPCPPCASNTILVAIFLDDYANPKVIF